MSNLTRGLQLVMIRNTKGYHEAWSRLCSISDNYEFTDNYRIAELTDMDAMKIYNEQVNNGTAGFHDSVYMTLDGTNYLIGFNYGH